MADRKTYELARLKVAHLERSLVLLEEEITDLLNRRKSDTRQLVAWRTILQAEEPPEEEGLLLVPVGDEERMEPDPVPTVEAYDDPLTGETIVEYDTYGSKTLAVRRYMAERGKLGVLPSEVAAYLQERSIKVSSGFPNNALFKMKQRGEAVLLGRRYVLKQFAPIPTGITFEEVKDQEPAEAGS